MVAILAAAGCDADTFSSPLTNLSSQSGTSVSSSVLTESREIDAGFIFAGQANYLCLPLTEPTPQAYSIVLCRSPPMRF